MNIQVRVLSAQATRQIKQLEAELAAANRQIARTSGAMEMAGATKGIQRITKWGNQIQWAGRQLQYNFTLPILIAGGAAAKFALDNEKAMTRVIKVYGDGSDAFNRLSKTEIPALGKAFEALSNRFGIAQADAINIAADWAAAGASGVALAKSVKLTMETMILGEMDAASATQALIAIQAQYGQSIGELSKTIDILNMVENQTGISMEGLVQGFARAAGTARSAGVDTQHLAAFLAALTPAAGSAANAGNALKTIFSRLMAPTKEAAQVMGLMGINTKELSWQSMNGSQRIEEMAKSFSHLDDAQKIVVSSVLASRYQINRFDVLMRDVINTNGYYQKSLASTSDAQRNFAQRTRELNAVLNSNPQRLKQIWVILQNAMADVIQPMIPVILLLASTIARLMNTFTQLDPAVQKLVLTFLLLLAAVGPLARYIGSVSVLLGLMSEAFHFAATKVIALGRASIMLITGPFSLIGSLVSGIISVLLTFAASVGRILIPALAALAGPAAAAMDAVMTAIGAAIINGRVLLGNAISILRANLMGVMSRFYFAVFAAPSIIAGAFDKLLAYIYVFFVTTVPGVISRAYAPIFAAGVKVWMGIMFAFTASVPAIMAEINSFWLISTGFISRQATAVYAASLGVFSRINAALVTAFVAVRRTLIMLPALIVWAMRNATAAVAAGARAMGLAFAVGMRAIPMIASKTWALVIASTKVLSALGPILLIVFTSPWTYAIAAVLGILYNFRDDLAKIWNNVTQDAASWLKPLVQLWDTAVSFIEKAFWRLPAGVRDALLTVVRIVQTAVKKVYELLSYLNPFAHHSPSLVESVTAGMAEIKKQYAGVGNVGSIFAKAARDLSAYKNAVASIGAGPFSDQRNDVAKAFPKMLGLFDSLIADLGRLNSILNAQAAAVSRQQIVVDKWKASLDAANAALDRQQAKLSSAQDALDRLNQAYSDHEAALSNYANAPLKGMAAMENQIFANEMAQKKLRLEMLQWEQQNGSIQDITNNMAKLAGTMEQLKGEAATLRAAGAGSDVLGPIDAQVNAMQQAYNAIAKTAQTSPISNMQKQLDELQKQADMLDLTKSIQFDPMIKSIQDLANTQKELTYDQIIKGIINEKAAMAALEPQIATATAAVQKQQAAVDAAKASRDAIQASYDAENAKLQLLNDEYGKTEDAIRSIESALNDMGGVASAQIAKLEAAARKAKAAADKLTPGAQNFLDAAGGNFPDVGGQAKIGREGGLGDQSKLIDEFTKGIADDVTKQFGAFDMFQPIKDMWNSAWKWMEQNVAPKVKAVWDAVKNAFGSMGFDVGGSSLVSGFQKVWDTVAKEARVVWGQLTDLWNLFKENFQKIVAELVKAGKKIWNEIGPELAKFKDLFPGLSKLLGELWNSFKIVAGIVGGVLLLAFKIIASILSNTIGPIIDFIIGTIKNLIKILRGLVEFVVGVLTGDWKLAWKGIKDVVGGIFNEIWVIISNVGKVIWGVIKGFVEGIVGFFQWLWDKLVGHSIIPDMINAIIDWFKKLPGEVWDAIKSMVGKVLQIAKDMWAAFSKKSVELWNGYISWLTGLPLAAYKAFIAIKDKLGSAAKTAWEWFKTVSSTKWYDIVTWVAGLPLAAYKAFITIKDKLGSAATTAWNWFKSTAITRWNEITTWIKGLPQSAYNSIISIKDKLFSAASSAFGALRDRAKAIVDGKGGLMDWIRGLPGRIGSALASVGSTVSNAVKASWNGAASWLNTNVIGALNKVTSKFGFNMPQLPKFEGGGVIPGKVSKRDNTIIAARTGEGVIVPELVRAMGGARGLRRANWAAQTGNMSALMEMGLPGYADGGIIGKVTGWLEKGAGTALAAILGAAKQPIRELIPGHPFAEDWLVGGAIQGWQNAAKKWGDKQDSSGNGVLPGIGYQYQVAALRNKFPGIIITSTIREGAVTASGNTSYHALGRAVDMDPQQKYFDWIRSTYGKHTKELIYSPMGSKQLKNGADYVYTGAVKDMHYNHIHWAYDKGGLLKPGMTMAYNGTGKDEVTLAHSDWETFSNVVSLMDRITQKSGAAGAPGSAMMARTGATLTTLEGRLRSQETRANAVTKGNGGGDTYNFYGDLVLPNITNGEDADQFIKHLKGLSG